MRKVLIREQSFYTVNSLANKLGIDCETAAQCVECLTTRGVVKLRTTNDVRDYDTVDAVDARGKYQFAFVGVAIFRGLCIVVYPKYLSEQKAADTLVVRQAFQAMRRSAGSYSQIAATAEDGLRRNDKLALILSLLESFAEYGIYSNLVRMYELNGSGDISWHRTIAMHTPILSRGKPIYLDYETNKTSNDESDYITRLHQCVLTKCSKFLHDTELSELLGIDEVELSDADFEEFGDRGTIAYRIDREIGVQFVTWKQDVLRMLRRFVADEEALVESDGVQCLGTSTFYNVWEKACKTAFGDMTNTRLGSLGLELGESFSDKENLTMLEIIPRPQWYAISAGEDVKLKEKNTLIPDIITMAATREGKRIFGILDAKYYTPILDGTPFGVPGVESITKQFLYQTSYKEFVTAHGFNGVVNAFLVPLSGIEEPVRMGYVKFPYVIAREDPPFSNEIEMWGLPAEKVFAAYLCGSALSTDCISVIFRQANFDE